MQHLYGNKFAATHGKTLTRTYKSWRSMKARCNNLNNPSWSNYGGRGITFCDRWSSFETFLSDMGERPEGTSLDRYPNANGNYEPGNCRWATPKQQSRNTRTNHLLTFNGVTRAASEWAELFGVSYATLRYRAKMEWPIQKVTFPAMLPYSHRDPSQKLDYQKAHAIRLDNRPEVEIAKDYGISPNTVLSVKQFKTWNPSRTNRIKSLELARKNFNYSAH